MCVRMLMNVLYLIVLLAKHHTGFLDSEQRQRVIDSALGIDLNRPIPGGTDLDKDADEDNNDDEGK